jgi:monoamine oxidase
MGRRAWYAYGWERVMGDEAGDVIILGAGAAGLNAARLLTQRGYHVTLVEARDRIGGRMWTIHPAESPIPIELGASFAHGRPPEMIDLFRQAGVTLYELPNHMLYVAPGQPESDAEGDDEEDEHDEDHGYDSNPILDAIMAWDGADMSLDDFIATQGSGPAWQAASAATRGYVAGYGGADPAMVSVRWWAQTERAEARIQSDRPSFLLEGYAKLADWLLAACDSQRLTLRLHTVATRVTWRHGQVTVALRTPSGAELGSISAARLVVTLPIGVLAADPGAEGALQFDPPLPELATALEGVAMGHAARVVLRLHERFWDGAPDDPFYHPRLSFLRSDHPLMPTWWTNYPILAPLITGWVGGPTAERFNAQGDSTALVAAAARALGEITGLGLERATALVAQGYAHNWSADPYARGGYSYLTVGGVEKLEPLTRPIDNTLYFAGEATDTQGYTGSVHAALATGTRVAAQISGA